MSDFITKQKRDIETRLREIDKLLQSWEDLREEKARLEATLTALSPRNVRKSSRSTAKSTGRNRRAPRGENKAKLLQALGDRPGATAATLAHVTGISKPTTATTLAKLATSGEVAKQELGGDAVGYGLPSTDAA